MLNEISSDTTANALIWRNNHDLQATGARFWADTSEGRVEALRLMKQFGDTVEELERWGWSTERIQTELARPVRSSLHPRSCGVVNDGRGAMRGISKPSSIWLPA